MPISSESWDLLIEESTHKMSHESYAWKFWMMKMYTNRCHHSKENIIRICLCVYSPNIMCYVSIYSIRNLGCLVLGSQYVYITNMLHCRFSESYTLVSLYCVLKVETNYIANLLFEWDSNVYSTHLLAWLFSQQKFRQTSPAQIRPSFRAVESSALNVK